MAILQRNKHKTINRKSVILRYIDTHRKLFFNAQSTTAVLSERSSEEGGKKRDERKTKREKRGIKEEIKWGKREGVEE